MLLLILLALAFLVLFTSLKRRRKSEKLEVAVHSLLYLLEILIVTSVVVNVFFRHDSFLKIESLLHLSVLKDYLFAYTIYQLVLLMTFKLKDSIDIDANTALKRIVDTLQLYGEFEQKVPKDFLEKFARDMQQVFLNKEQQKLAETLDQLAVSYNDGTLEPKIYRMRLKQYSIDLDFFVKMSSYGWMQSLVLRWIKK